MKMPAAVPQTILAGLFAAIAFTWSGAAGAKDFKESKPGVTHFGMQRLKICCSYVGGAGKIAKISCSRLGAKLETAVLDASGNLLVSQNASDAALCSASSATGNEVQVGDSWKKSEFTCNADNEGVSCVMGRKGFTISRGGVKSWP